MTKPTASERARQRRASGLLCELPGCHAPVTGLSKFCNNHDKRNERTGHPLGRTIRAGELRPFRKLAAAFIEANRHHPGIRAALDWITRLIAEAKEPRYIGRSSTAEQRLARWLARMRREGVDPRGILATVAAMHVLREYRPRDFKSDRHWNHQLAVRVLRLVPAPAIDRWTGDRVRRSYDRCTVATRELLSHRLSVALGLLCARIAREIMRELTAPDPDHLPATAIPFTTTTGGQS